MEVLCGFQLKSDQVSLESFSGIKMESDPAVLTLVGNSFYLWCARTKKSRDCAEQALFALSDDGTSQPADVVEQSAHAWACGKRLVNGKRSTQDSHESYKRWMRDSCESNVIVSKGITTRTTTTCPTTPNYITLFTMHQPIWNKVWRRFGFYKKEGNLDKSLSICKVCRTNIKYSGSTTNLKLAWRKLRRRRGICGC